MTLRFNHTTQMPLKCFIATAFDRQDTDRLFDRSIKPLLRQKGISPFRVDRSNRNEDVDDQILLELRQCDFAIADLTYARPSVYFEAGVAQGRKVPIIYTCRRDHFRQQPNDQHGNLRVHFDLQMKPIIKWDDPPSRVFSRQLDARVAHVIRPLLQQQRAAAAVMGEQAAFAALSAHGKWWRIRQLCRKNIASRGFRTVTDHYASFRRQDTLFLIQERCSASFTRNEIYERLSDDYDFLVDDAVQPNIRGRRLPRRIHRDVLFCSINRLPVSRVAAALPAFSVAKREHEIVATVSRTIGIQRHSPGNNPRVVFPRPEPIQVPITTTVHVISGILSERAFKTALKSSLRGFAPAG